MELDEKYGPDISCRGVEVHDMNAFEASGKPLFKAVSAFTRRQLQNPILQFAENNWIDDDFRLVVEQPFDGGRNRPRLGGLAQDVGIDEVLHEWINSELQSKVSR